MNAPDQADHDASSDPSIAAAPPRSFDAKAMTVSLLLTAIFDIGLAILAFNAVKQTGASDQIAYLASGIGPLTMMMITWIRARALSGASVVILVFLLLSSAAAFIGGADSRLLIVKDSTVTAGFGLACLISPLLLPKPLMFYFGAKFARWNQARPQLLVRAMKIPRLSQVPVSDQHRVGHRIPDRGRPADRHRVHGHQFPSRQPDHQHPAVRLPRRADHLHDHARQANTGGCPAETRS